MISVRVDKETRKKMSLRKEVNWSEVVRVAIADRLEERESRNMAVAVLLNEKNVVEPTSGYDSTKVVREWRERNRRR